MDQYASRTGICLLDCKKVLIQIDVENVESGTPKDEVEVSQNDSQLNPKHTGQLRGNPRRPCRANCGTEMGRYSDSSGGSCRGSKKAREASQHSISKLEISPAQHALLPVASCTAT